MLQAAWGSTAVNAVAQAAHYADLRGFVEQVVLQRLLTVVKTVEWPLTIARRATTPLLEQVNCAQMLECICAHTSHQCAQAGCSFPGQCNAVSGVFN